MMTEKSRTIFYRTHHKGNVRSASHPCRRGIPEEVKNEELMNLMNSDVKIIKHARYYIKI